jgi:hypothetical protein
MDFLKEQATVQTEENSLTIEEVTPGQLPLISNIFNQTYLH